MEDLEKEYMHLHNQEQDILKNLKRQKDEDLLKGQAEKNQKAFWDRTPEFRFVLQKAFSSSNRLPQHMLNAVDVPVVLYDMQFGNSGKSAKKHSKDSKKSDEDSDEEWLRISQMHRRIATFRDKSIDKWQRKTQVTTGAAAIKGKLLAFNLNVSEQVASYMRDPNRMMKQMQLSRSTVGVFGTVESFDESFSFSFKNDAKFMAR
ncbi:hypothetical protein GH714_019036 [Hevea brasiliensis]|uniref:AATF leucine zipper-containing domain-containing protein n=1 Tax=Hevea brasiliensis TaxID=3981 RepID=A0A6A6LU32_HEVBR|nr:hypothetical protein GH714_019036 [Hevea brasiliensis]